MYRSFTDRILGGVCGGLALDWHVNVWLLRVVFLILTPITQGTSALVYVSLWWLMPQETLIKERKRSVLRLLFGIGIIIIMLGVWLSDQTGWLAEITDYNLLMPVLLLTTSAVFLWRQAGE
jgi:phage shock protein PspC (stress-responsive transcriptional regulator)